MPDDEKLKRRRVVETLHTEELFDKEGRIWQTPERLTYLKRSDLQSDMACSLAWDLLRSNSALITARDGGEDSAGRAKLRQEVPAELVARVFEIADAYLSEVLRRGGMRRIVYDEE